MLTNKEKIILKSIKSMFYGVFCGASQSFLKWFGTPRVIGQAK